MFKGKRSKNYSGRRYYRRDLDSTDEFITEFPKNHIERREIMDEIDWDDEEFLEFLSMIPEVEEYLYEQE